MSNTSKQSKKLVNKILLIGWGSADWKSILPLVKAGKMPNVEKLLAEGTKATAGVMDPPILSAAWNCLFTGKVPSKHGVYTFTEVKEDKILPLSSNVKKAKTLWEIISSFNLKVHQVGAMGSHPTTSINGISISDCYAYSTKENLSEHSIFPRDAKEKFGNLLNSKDDLSQQQIDAYLTDKRLTSEAFDDHIDAIKAFIAYTSNIQNAALKIMDENEDWDQMSVFFNQLSNLTFKFMPYHLSHNEDADQELKSVFRLVLTKAYQQLDTYLGILLEKAGEDASVFLVSQGGYLPDPKWIAKLNKAQSTWEYNTPGIWLFKGKKANKKEEFFELSVFDTVPTILVLLGLPFAKDFDGKISLARKHFAKVENYIESFDSVVNTQKINYDLSVADLLEEQLRDLNYSTKSKYDLKEQKEYTEARIAMSIGQQINAIPALEDLWARYPYHSWYGGRLAGCYLAVNRLDEAKELIDTVTELGDEIPEMHLLKGQILISERKFRSAAKEYEIVEKQVGMMSNLYGQIADAYLQMNQAQEGIKRLKLEAENAPNPQIYLTMAMVYMQNRMQGQAIEPLKKAVELAPYHPIAQFHLGNTYYQIQKYEEAAEAFEKAKMFMSDPKGQQQIQQMLVKIYRDHLQKTDKIQEMQKAFEDSIGSRGEITIVSGLPRSGTSMMMQMLVRGGLEAFTDGQREADENNKKGYYEHEAVKSLSRDKRFLKEVGNKVVKIISHLLHHLPHVYKYKIVFMDREIEEVMNSQHKMLGRLGKDRGDDKANSLKLLKPFKESREKAIKWCQDRPKFVEILVVPYHEVISNPLEQAKQINAFLGGQLDEVAMASVVDKSLYRERTESTEA